MHSVPSCSHCTPMTAILDTERTGLKKNVNNTTIIGQVKNTCLYQKEINSLAEMYTKNKNKELIVELKKSRGKRKPPSTSGSRGGAGEQL